MLEYRICISDVSTTDSRNITDFLSKYFVFRINFNSWWVYSRISYLCWQISGSELTWSTASRSCAFRPTQSPTPAERNTSRIVISDSHSKLMSFYSFMFTNKLVVCDDDDGIT